METKSKQVSMRQFTFNEDALRFWERSFQDALPVLLHDHISEKALDIARSVADSALAIRESKRLELGVTAEASVEASDY